MLPVMQGRQGYAKAFFQLHQHNLSLILESINYLAFLKCLSNLRLQKCYISVSMKDLKSFQHLEAEISKKSDFPFPRFQKSNNVLI